jgi:hypothetical protein
MLASDMRIAARTLPEALGPVEALDLAFTGHDPRLAAMTLLRLVFPSWKAREEIRGNIAAAFKGEIDAARAEAIERLAVRRAARGSLALPSNPHFLDEPAPPGPRSNAGAAWRPSPGNERYLRRFLGLAEARGLTVYWVVTPVSPSERALRERSGLDRGFRGYLRRLQGEFPKLVVLDGQPIGFDRTAFGDQYHIDGRAAAILSHAAADAMEAVTPALRWVELARPADDGARLARDGVSVQSGVVK